MGDIPNDLCEKSLDCSENPLDLYFNSDKCKKTYSRGSGLGNRAKTRNETRKAYQCNFCSLGFHNRSLLIRHNKRHDRVFRCEKCHKLFRERFTLNRHRIVHSTGEKTFKCLECTSSFKYRSSLQRHMQIHAGSKPFQCSTCEMCFALESHLNKHLRFHENERLMRNYLQRLESQKTPETHVVE